MIALAAVSLFWLGLGFYAGRKDVDMAVRSEIERHRAEYHRDSRSTN